MNRHRLIVLRNYLCDNVQDDQFNLGLWHCGTTSCAFGHAANILEFQEAGLFLAVIPGTRSMYEPCFQHATGYDAAAAFMGISCKEAINLFNPSSYEDDKRTRQDVIDRINKFLMKQARTKTRRK